MKAPLFTAEAHCGTQINTASLVKNKNLLLYFFPEIDFNDTNRVTQEAFLFKNYFVRLDLKQNEVVGITNDPRDLNKLFVQRFGVPFHLVYDRDHKIAEKFEKVLNEQKMERTLVIVRKGGAIHGVYQGAGIEKKLKELVQWNLLPWHKKLFKKAI